MTAATVLGLDAATYVPHALHRGDAAWLETNCYVDLLIEVLHALGHEPLAALGFTVRAELEADQWTFFKFSHADLETLFGVEIVELNPWTSVLDQVEREVRAGRMPLVEVDSWFLPDTLSTAYKQHHSKSSIGVETLDVAGRNMRYFHNSGYYEVSGDDFDGLFPGHSIDEDRLVPYIEIVKTERTHRLSPSQLGDAARRLLSQHVARMPEDNPFERYAERFPADVEAMRSLGKAAGEARFHLYAFAFFRQFGSAFFHAAEHLRWLERNGGVDRVAPERVVDAAAAYDQIASGAKSLQLRTARAVLTGKHYDATASFEALAASWQRAADLLAPTAS